MELEGESVLLGILGGLVGTSPVVLALSVTLDTAPLCGILGCHLIPVVREDVTVGVHIAVPTSGDVS